MSKLVYVLPVISGLLLLTNSIAWAGHDDDDGYSRGVCSSTAYTLIRACKYDAKDDYWLGKAKCLNVTDHKERWECFVDNYADMLEANEECRDVLDARLELCDEIGEAAYDPDFDPENFVDPRDIGDNVVPNPYFPLVAGNTWVYEGDGETITVTVTDKTKLIDGVTCVTVNDVAEEDGVVVENTDDWYAQDLEGNVWYCGEIAQNFELFDGDDPEEPELVDVDGSFKAGRDEAKGGILIKAVPEVGDILRQEFALGDAEDIAKVLSVNANETSPVASCNGACLQTLEYTPLEPGHFEHKYYVPGVGLILEVDMEGNRVELVEFTSP